MALTKCKECGAAVSKNAKACPGCGAKQGVGACGCLAAMIIFPFLVIIVIAISGGGGSSGSRSSSAPTGDSLLQNSAWDGSVYRVEQYLKKTLKDPDSYEGIEWSPVQKLDDGSYSVRHKYRAKNSFGGYVIENQLFFYDTSGNVTSVIPFGGE